jgi:ATPase subunit of ABC transporter with duplicated ATPase domains
MNPATTSTCRPCSGWNTFTNWSGSFVLVSHDRQLLDAVTNGSWILRDKRCTTLPFPARHAGAGSKDESDALRHKAEQKEIDRVTASANGWRPGARFTTTKIWPAKPNRWKNRSNG